MMEHCHTWEASVEKSERSIDRHWIQSMVAYRERTPPSVDDREHVLDDDDEEDDDEELRCFSSPFIALDKDENGTAPTRTNERETHRLSRA